MLRDHLDVIQRFAAVQKNPHHLLETKALDNLAAQSWGHESRRPNIKKPARRAPWRFRNYRWLREDATDDRCGMGAQMQKPPRRGQRRFRNYRWLRGRTTTVTYLSSDAPFNFPLTFDAPCDNRQPPPDIKTLRTPLCRNPGGFRLSVFSRERPGLVGRADQVQSSSRPTGQCQGISRL